MKDSVCRHILIFCATGSGQCLVLPVIVVLPFRNKVPGRRMHQSMTLVWGCNYTLPFLFQLFVFGFFFSIKSAAFEQVLEMLKLMPKQQHAAVDMHLWKVKEIFIPETRVTKMQNVIVKKECKNLLNLYMIYYLSLHLPTISAIRLKSQIKKVIF